MTGRAALLLVLGVAATAGAHERSASYSRWTLHGSGAHVTVRLAALEATRLPWPPQDRTRLAGYLTTHLRLLAGDAPCTLTDPPRALATAPGQVAVEWDVACAAGGPLRLASTLLLDVAPSHLHFAHLRWPDGATIEHVLSEVSPEVVLDRATAPSLLAAVGLGVAHILAGWDHLAFVLALVLLGGTVLDTARVVTGFTVAHSVTLALAVLGWVRPEQAPVEALIGVSIALVAAENCWLAGRRSPLLPWTLAAVLLGLAAAAAAGFGTVPALPLLGLALFTACHMTRLGRAARPERLRWHAAFGFGLLHGFGFASVLIDAALPRAALAPVLLGFNAGVDLGQLAVVALAWPVVTLVRAWRPPLLDVGSAAVAGLGVFWFVSRAFG